MRIPAPAVLSALLLAACSQGDAGNAGAPAPAPQPTGPAPKTPLTGITPAPGKTPTWLGARDGTDDPKTAPYGNLLDQPVVKDANRAR